MKLEKDDEFWKYYLTEFIDDGQNGRGQAFYKMSRFVNQPRCLVLYHV